MSLSQRQLDAVGRITGKYPETFHPEAIKAFFSYTDKGKVVAVSPEAEQDYEVLVEAHKWYEVTNEQMMLSFHECGGFLLADYLTQNLPLSFLIRVFDCCRKGFGFIPLLYYAPEKDWGAVRYERGRYAPCYIL